MMIVARYDQVPLYMECLITTLIIHTIMIDIIIIIIVVVVAVAIMNFITSLT